MNELSELPLRFVEKTRRDGDCIVWTASTNELGYGRYRTANREWKAHRYAYVTQIAPVPPGLDLDHLCRNPGCVNPAHLEPVTHAENMRRGNGGKWWAAKTHCPRGHEYTEENTYRGSGRAPKRECRTCNRMFGRGPRPKVSS